MPKVDCGDYLQDLFWLDTVTCSREDFHVHVDAHARRNRDRGEPHDSAPPTPPGKRVRTRRFGRLIGLLGAREDRPSAARAAFGNARWRAGLLLSRQGPCRLPAVCAAKSRPTPRRRSSANRVRPRFHCFQGTVRSRRLVQWSSPRNTDGVSQKPK